MQMYFAVCIVPIFTDNFALYYILIYSNLFIPIYYCGLLSS